MAYAKENLYRVIRILLRYSEMGRRDCDVRRRKVGLVEAVPLRFSLRVTIR